MRNLVIARVLKQESECAVGKPCLALFMQDDNYKASEQLKRLKRFLPNASMAPVFSASDVVRAGEIEGLADWAAWIRNPYRLCLS